MTPNRPAAVVLLLLVLSAGCAAPVADGGTTTRQSGGIAVTDGTLPLDPDPVWNRTAALLEVSVSRPQSVRVADDPGDLVPFGAGSTEPPRFWTLLGVTRAGGLNESVTRQMENGVTGATGSIAVYLGTAPSASEVEWLLAHEFTHYAQFSSGWAWDLGTELPDTTDGAFVRRALLEGGAVYTTDTYVRRHVPNGTPNSALYDRVHGLLRPGSAHRFVNLAYVEGTDYVAATVSTPAETRRVFETPPTTSEQVLHATDEPPRPLNVSVADAGDWRVAATDRLGEAFVRTALENGVGADRAAGAAAGWGADELVAVGPGDGDGNRSYVWVTRWDDAANATAFAGALNATLDEQGTETADGWRVDGAAARVTRHGAATVVLTVGDPAFVRNASVAADGPAVTVRVAA